MSVNLETPGKPCTDWDAKAYQQFSRLRQQPVNELLDRVRVENPRHIYDLGCGTGIATRLLAERWPRAQLQGIDSSEEMLREARCLPIKASWQQCDLLDWKPESQADLLFAAAVLHFIDDHEQLLPRLLGYLSPGGCLAAHMPNWRDALWYRLMLDTLEDGGPGGTPLGTTQLRQRMAARPLLRLKDYYRLLAPVTRSLEIWESRQLQVVDGKSPVYDWVRVSALRQVMLGLDKEEQARFIYHFVMRVHKHYPQESDGHTLFPFKRIFIVARV
ncbi:methyltransferase domain-containing protein [Pseudomonas sp. B2M1-30]|uniref:methyltransferase domain-containing protein n=1 Tax=Pseudomonas TaxID=286 RepID=UPI0021C929BD|nr:MULTISPECIES: methyltransferase domain-containing protein [Pseudomonas]MCU0120374.1 methyltransferase domain-containing protein [Pseudomonas sp. B2M1-30]MCU7262392.1 methyltransferase domain-containing protein [Pseudomonas koreensis]